MAMYIKIFDADQKKPYEFERRIGSGRLDTCVLPHYKPTGFMVQADGDELRSLLNQFTHIPFSKFERVQIWKGDFAQFIIDNCRL